MEKSRTIINPVVGDKMTFLKTTEETNGEFLLALVELQPGGGVDLHYHATIQESFKVVQGELTVIVGEETHVLRPGQTAIAPINSHHAFWNRTDGPISFEAEIRPARNFEAVFRIGYGLANDGQINSNGHPKNIWQSALLYEMAETYTPKVPLFIQKGMGKILAAIAKWKSVEKSFEKYL
ncbi:cupin domain-containing protein [Brevibacillus dissolubilis]|uniref:cupin domain-containing protein n=1 Tax=Brevibacillus dissolubilis TaxID=1844116 RepID=UPI001117292F|nr:cupin domain-containing protein [Brevibacillus dissolubilis]